MGRSQRAAWLAIGLSGAVLLLAAFWLVLQQSLDRAEQHWAQARRADLRADPCARSLSGGEGCAGGVMEGAGRRPSGISVGVSAAPAR